MGFDEGRIVFNNDNGIYYSGQTVYGKLIFDQRDQKTCRGIYVSIKGFCYVHWRTSHTRTVNGKHETYYEDHTSRDEYLHQKTYLIGSAHGEQVIPPGHYEYPFQCLIPPNCPSSYEGTHGHIRYEVKVVVDRAFRTDQEKKAVIRVIAPIDLNTEPGAKDPVQMQFNEVYYCCCARSGSLTALVKLPCTGFVPGQGILIEMGCENVGSVGIDSITFVLKKDTKFHAQGSTRSESAEIAKVDSGSVPSGGTRNISVSLMVPHVDLPNVRACRYIDIDYRLKVTLSPDGCHSDSSQSRKIIIGTVPLLGSNYPPAPGQIVNQNVPVVTQPAHSPYPSGNAPYPTNTSYPGPMVTPYPTSPKSQDPPSYNEVVAGNSPYPTSSSPYIKSPSEKSPYPGGSNVTPYPTSNSPYPASGPTPYPNTPSQKAPYPDGPSITPYPSSNPPYPTSNAPYPTSNSPHPTSPYPSSNAPTNAPYPTSPSPFPSAFGNAQFPGGMPAPTGLRTGTFGFIGQPGGGSAGMPLLPPGAAVPYPNSPAQNPFAAASAPAGTPDDEEKK